MSRIFDKLNGILLAGLFGGLLVAGIGSGIAFAEYTSFEYDDETLLGGKERAEDAYSYEMEKGERVVIPLEATIEYEDTVTPGTVLLISEYDPEGFEMIHDTTALDYATVVEAYPNRIASDFSVFMQDKDVVLDGLKNGVIIASGIDYRIEQKVIINPADKGRVFSDHQSAISAHEESK